ncbi:putative ABC transport system permease protein [Mucilaginibacter gracilis]|uniref:Putative ABC transport system permease protein n=1 Tax=Mucilaginibacter gracilis TaxID=423350 RepID=A0A495J7Z1_9SPHI|nr:ABC transporter permease [Mucilaginibacter gracilis]RKR84548.1 putative ABC transport system permease protein [Mucilaginibacter gracilis]
MFKHLFKLIWNKKKQNSLLITEMLISFMVMFAVFTLIVNYYRNYNTPMGFTYNHVWAVNYDDHQQFKNTDSLTLYYETLRKTIKSMPQIVEVSFAGGNIPFSDNTNSTGFTYKGHQISRINNYKVGAGYKDVFDMNVLEGRWFNSGDKAAAHRPVVINETLKNELFGNGRALGQIIGDRDKEKGKLQIIGVVQDMKDKGDYYKAGRAIFNPIDTGAFRYIGQMVIKVTPNADAAFESRLYKTLTNYMKTASVEIVHLPSMRQDVNKSTVIPMVILLTVAGFLIINVALGLFGVLWYNINKRKGEIGLRRAIGASGNAVSGQIVAESLVLASLSLIVGAFFAVQFPLLHVFDLAAGVYITAIILAIVFIYLLVLVCSLYPGRQAAAIYPAVALHEE